MVKTVTTFVFLSVVVLFVSCSRSPQATQPIKEKNANEQGSNKNENTTVSQETNDADDFDSINEVNRCGNAKNRIETVQCLQSELMKADRKMNALYKKYISEFKPDRYSNAEKAIANLVKAQGAWLSYRDNNCDAVQDLFEGGTQQVEEGVMCRLEMTVKRIKELKRIYGRK